ncbi:phosphotransferase [Cellulomonas fengjieae]|uniref:Aminoglycoside phosphotransferase family protein n=1 Tax=Cellulomonas fengjieae TaxID=2819978 RepID=A0ABS3SL14_9CELL|nr:aminoglycoside phosphotransferase family protein [Cellulomonas fengjieae]MBO3086430.1 aminoglycoside phosphotransferase family protein [Cellulomonas fengjieae]QVI66704.1 aminoglycoside phosphotransferase family protein [Cellulomonas fengjieae]
MPTDASLGPVDEIPLPGGNVGGAVRVGDTVRRPTGPWTPAVHELLRFLDEAGLPLIPRVLGIDDRGREILTFLPGRVLDIGRETLTDTQIRSAMHWLRDFHAVVAGFPRESRRWRFVERALEPGEIICHHDAAMYNMAFAADELAGVFDWDVAGPGIPLDDVAIFAWNTAVLFPDADAAEVAHALRTIADGYGGLDPHDLLDRVIVRMTESANRIEAAQTAGDPGMLRLGTVGEPASTRARIAVLAARLPELHEALST